MTSNKSDLARVCQDIKIYATSDVLKHIMDLLEIRIDTLRIKNDTAPIDEVVQNQGALKELRWLLNFLTTTTR